MFRVPLRSNSSILILRAPRNDLCSDYASFEVSLRNSKQAKYIFDFLVISLYFNIRNKVIRVN